MKKRMEAMRGTAGFRGLGLVGFRVCGFGLIRLGKYCANASPTLNSTRFQEKRLSRACEGP